MIDRKRAEDIVRALRCTSKPGMECDGQACAYCTVEELDEVTKQVLGKDVWTSCNVDGIGIDAADMISALLEENERMSDTIMTLRIMMRGDCGVCMHRHGGIGKEPCASCIDTDERGAWQLEGDEEHGQPKPGV